MEQESKNEDHNEYPLQKVPHDKLKYVMNGFKGWDFIFINNGGIANSKEQGKIQAYLKGI